MTNYKIFELGDVDLQCGLRLRGARLAYQTYGELNARRNNVVVFPTFFSSRHEANEPMIGPGMALDPSRYFIIIPNLFGNGISSSPSNTPEPYDRARFPVVSYYDNIRFQHRLVTEQFNIEKVRLVCGFSMGAQQTFHWGALYPDMVERIAPWCGSARTSVHNRVFLEGVKASLCADAAWNNGWYDSPPTKGLRAMARVYAGWAPSQAFYRERVYLDIGFASLEDYLITSREGRYLQNDSNNILAMVATWQAGDISDNPLYGGDFEKALGAIKAKAFVMPSETDQYFPPEDNRIEVSMMPNAELRVIPTIWGHTGGGPGRNPADTAFIDAQLKELLGS